VLITAVPEPRASLSGRCSRRAGRALVDFASNETTSLPYVAGYGSVAWLSD
jgi:hypothetical protein